MYRILSTVNEGNSRFGTIFFDNNSRSQKNAAGLASFC